MHHFMAGSTDFSLARDTTAASTPSFLPVVARAYWAYRNMSYTYFTPNPTFSTLTRSSFPCTPRWLSEDSTLKGSRPYVMMPNRRYVGRSVAPVNIYVV